jgi:hypothetical protein
LNIDAEVFRNAYQIVSAVGSHAGLLTSQFVRVSRNGDGLGLNLTGLAVGEATIPAAAIELQRDQLPEKDLYFDRRLLGGFLGAHERAKSFRVTFKQDAVTLRSKSHRLDITSVEVSGYQSWKPAKKASPVRLQEEELEQLRFLQKFTSATAAADHLNAIRMSPGYGALASDSFSMAAVLDKKSRLRGFFPSILPGLISSEVRAVVERNGTGVQFDHGYLYQPVSENCHKSFPEKTLRELLAGVQKSKPVVTIATKTFRDVFQQLAGFVFGASDYEKALIECSGDAAKGMVTMQLKLTQGMTRRAFKQEVARDFSVAWPVKRIEPWLMELPDVEQVDCYASDFGTAFRACYDERTYMLAVAEVAE